MKKILNNLIQKYSKHYYHSNHKSNALKILNTIESFKGKLDPKIKKLSDDYASGILGWKGFSPWLYVYSAVAGEFKEGWIPDNYYGKVVVPQIKGKYGEIADLKGLASALFGTSHFPDKIYYINGLLLSNNYQVLSEKDCKELAFSNSEEIVYKVDNSLQGRGIFFLRKNDFNIKSLESLGNGVIQEKIKQHPFFQEIVPNSVATIRITTAINNYGIISPRASYLRIGRLQDTHVKSASHIRIPINLKTGELYHYGYTTDWRQIEKHPDTNFSFAAKHIPQFSELQQTASYLHKMVPFTRSIGWDIIIDDSNRIKVMEWNGSHNDIKFSEATQGPCFADLDWENLWRNN